MATIEQRIEGSPFTLDYTGHVLTEEEIAKGRHRSWVGGHWEDGHGKTQVDYLASNGLRPEHKLIDIGCGSFRAGRYLIDYLDSGNYYGVDANHSVMQAGYENELNDEQRARVPVTNLRANDRFDADFGVKFDYGIAQSVFTHVSLNHVRLCLFRVAKVMEPGGKFYATFFEEPAERDLDYLRPAKRAKERSSERDVFWNYRSDFKWAAKFSPWRMRYIGDWGHVAGQHMIEFTRIEDPVKGATQARPAAASPHTGSIDRFVTRARRWTARQIAPK